MCVYYVSCFTIVDIVIIKLYFKMSIHSVAITPVLTKTGLNTNSDIITCFIYIIENCCHAVAYQCASFYI